MARVRFAEMSALGLENIPRDGNWMPAMALLASVMHFLDDPEYAEQVYGWLIDFSGLVVIAGLPTEMLGSVDLFLALLAATMRHWDEFDRHAAMPCRQNEAMEMPVWLATAQYEIGAILAARARDQDADRARCPRREHRGVAAHRHARAAREGRKPRSRKCVSRICRGGSWGSREFTHG